MNRSIFFWQSYQFSGETMIGAIMKAIGVVIIIAAICIPGPGFPILPMIVLMIIVMAAGMMVIWLAGAVEQLQLRNQWKKEFFQNNIELNIDLSAAKKVVKYLRENTSYLKSDLVEVLNTIAASLGQNTVHTTWSYEVSNAYHYFKNGAGDLIPTYCPKK
jgi:hypothetical protein